MKLANKREVRLHLKEDNYYFAHEFLENLLRTRQLSPSDQLFLCTGLSFLSIMMNTWQH